MLDEEKLQHQLELNTKQNENNGAMAIVLTNENRVFRQTKSGDQDSIISNILTLKSKGSMNDVFLPVKAPI